MIVLIPAFEPGASLADVVRQLRIASPATRVLVVDDGSGPAYDPALRAARAEDAEVLRYDVNAGKGHALKVGLRHILSTYPGEDVVTADCDGQHCTADILRVAERLRTSGGAMVLGGRRFAGDVPARSRFGNAVSRVGFRLVTGLSVHDTQTGLRGFPAGMLDWLLALDGERFEYELTMLLRSRDAGVAIDEIPIETIYLEQNASSHFRPVVDSLRVMRPLIVFAAVSFGSFVVDVVALELLYLATGSLATSVVGARLISGTGNFFANRRVVFRTSGGGVLRHASRYLALALTLLAASYGGLALLTGVGMPLLAAKLITDAALYVVSYLVQRWFVFGHGRRGGYGNPRSRRPAAAAAPTITTTRNGARSHRATAAATSAPMRESTTRP
ncbi:putative flippase GtrA [Conyzicola lurida]|uniref:Putative flippase GtrA n=1 Tax=Conyzicola lurida TaxID=1172621 RepID=A0A841AI35_9MICO|nr:putative flippase GtrA [Conyzicola lurida]